jgi:hypothetical protein
MDKKYPFVYRRNVEAAQDEPPQLIRGLWDRYYLQQ